VIPLLQYVQPILHAAGRLGDAACLGRAAPAPDEAGLSLGGGRRPPADGGRPFQEAFEAP
jgi:hypothetical protein